MKRFAIGIALAALVLAPLTARACDESSIDNISSDGTILVIDGETYEVTSGDASGWSEGDTVQVCNDRIVDTDQDGESVMVSER